MSDPIKRAGLAPRFWERKRLDQLSKPEWEALCDGCGKCCLNMLEDEEAGEVALTRVACRLFADETCRCSQYPIRHQFVPECIVLSPSNLDSHAYWMPETCAYRRLHLGQALPHWHPLLTGTHDSVHEAGVSMLHATVSEFEIADEEWEDHIIEEPTGGA